MVCRRSPERPPSWLKASLLLCPLPSGPLEPRSKGNVLGCKEVSGALRVTTLGQPCLGGIGHRFWDAFPALCLPPLCLLPSRPDSCNGIPSDPWKPQSDVTASKKPSPSLEEEVVPPSSDPLRHQFYLYVGLCIILIWVGLPHPTSATLAKSLTSLWLQLKIERIG